jgi:DNA-binding response OmpR family regulator
MFVLIVEDKKEMAGLLKKGLEEENHSVSLAFDGRDALEMAQALEYDAMAALRCVIRDTARPVALQCYIRGRVG